MQDSTGATVAQNTAKDPIETSLVTIAQNIIVGVFGLLPILFIPVSYIQLEYSKVIIVIVGVLIALMLYSFSILRSGSISLPAPFMLASFWGIVGATILSAILSGDMSDALFGDQFGIYTALFAVLMGVSVTTIALFGQSKTLIMRLYLTLSASAVVLTLYHVSRLLLGPDTLSFGLFTSSVGSPIGGWNQLGLFFGLVILLSIVAIEQLPLTKWGRVMFTAVIAFSLMMLTVVNFFAVWIVLGLVSLLVIMYSLTKDRFSTSANIQTSASTTLLSVFISTAVFITSLIFIIGGPSVGGFINSVTNIEYVEVRPSFSATIDIGKEVYKENAFVGVGSNKFVDAWRLYKDPSINQTVFWSTDFVSGSGYIPTQFVNTGIVGVIAFLTFFFFFLKAGFTMLMSSTTGDRFWYFIASSSFVAALYLWGMSFVYLMGTSMLLLAAVFTGIVYVSYATLMPATRTFKISVFANRRSGIVLVGIVMVFIVASAAALYYTMQHYSSVTAFNKALLSATPGASIESVEQAIVQAYNNYDNDLFARQLAQYQVAKMNALLAVAEPTTEQQQQFQQSAVNGINAINLAIQKDQTDAENYFISATIYGILAAAGVADAADRAYEMLDLARQYDPANPEADLLEAQVRSSVGDIEAARSATVRSIEKKPNFTTALFYLAQLDIASGNVEAAIASTQAIVSLEPNNPARHYQLGVLQVSAGLLDQAIISLERALRLNPDYANARYFLALAYNDSGRSEEALAELQKVAENNPENPTIKAAISAIEAGETILPAASVTGVSTEQLEDPIAVEEDGGTVISSEDLDSDLVSPVNVVTEDGEETTETSNATETSEEVTASATTTE